jgi:hypothetical protein
MSTIQMSNTTYTLLCVVEGEKYAFEVVASPGDNILDLKVKIKEQISNFLQGIDAARLILWKVRCFWRLVLRLRVTPLQPRVVIPVDYSTDLCEHIQNLGPDFSHFAQNLSSRPTDSVDKVFQNQISSPHLSIIVELPASRT